MAEDFRATARTEHEHQLLDVVRRYLHTYNTDVDLYMTGGEIHDKDQFMAMEKAIPAAAPLASPGGLGKPPA
ncbi:MAG: hypothetical protein ACREUE_08940 [Panacagrimonas sp.]